MHKSNEEVEQLQKRVASLAEKNARLSSGLAELRGRLSTMHTQLSALAEPPLRQATFLKISGSKVEILLGGMRYRVNYLEDQDPASWQRGQAVYVNDANIIVTAAPTMVGGEIANVLELMEGSRAIVTLGAGVNVTVALPEAMSLQIGDSVVVDTKSLVAIERIVRRDVEQLLTPQVPQVSWADIGGLDEQIERIRDAIELPFSEPELYARYQLRAPRGVLLAGPPGCGKTLIAKAVANAIAKRKGGKGYFLSVKGPELLNKYVGETERHIRALFARARKLATPTEPVVIFFDEMEALFKTRGSGISSDVETLIVPQLLAELDGVESLGDVIVIGASNRQDMIDPAVLRPGRLDLQIQITRPNEASAAQILSIHLDEQVPLDPSLEREALCREVAGWLFAPSAENLLRSASEINKNNITVSDLTSGALLASIVEEAKKQAVKRTLAAREAGVEAPAGIERADFRSAVQTQRQLLREQVRGQDKQGLRMLLGN